MDRLIPLGTAGWLPAKGKHTMSLAVEAADNLFLIDLGTGVSRLASPLGEEMLRRHDRVLVLLSHFHLDHLVGVAYLPHFLAGKRVSIWGPGQVLHATPTREILERLLAPPFSSLPLKDFPMDLEVVDLKLGAQMIGGVEVRVAALSHPGGSVGFRLGDAVSYISDTECGSDSLPLVKGCDLLCHEAWVVRRPGARPVGHSEVEQVAELALAAGVQRLGLMHWNPGLDYRAATALLRRAARLFPNTFPLRELVPVPLQSLK